MTSLIRRPAWKALAEHSKKIKPLHLRKLFADDPKRGQRLTMEAAGLFLDYSKNRVTGQTIQLLLKLANESRLRERIDAMFRRRKDQQSPKMRAVASRRLRAPEGADNHRRTAKMSCRKSTPCSTGWPRFASRVCVAAMERSHRQAH